MLEWQRSYYLISMEMFLPILTNCKHYPEWEESGEVEEARCGSVGVLEEDAVLVLVIAHEVHENVGDQQDIPLIPPGHQGQAQQDAHGQADELKFFGVDAFVNRLCGAKDHRLDDGEEGVGAVEHEIPVPARHDAVAALGQIPGNSQEIGDASCQQARARREVPALVGIEQTLHHLPQGDDGHINRGVLLDHAGQDCCHSGDGDAPPVQTPEEPEDQGCQEGVLVDVIAGAAGIGGGEGQRSTQHQPRPGGKTVMASQFPEGNKRRGQHRRLQDLQGGGIRCDTVEGEQQIIDGGDMDGEMAQGAVPLHGGYGQARLLHAVEHLGKDGEIIGGHAEAQHPAYGPDGDEDEKRHAHRRGQPEIEGLFRTPGQGTGGDVGPALDGVYY